MTDTRRPDATALDQTVGVAPNAEQNAPGGWSDWLTPSALAGGLYLLNQKAHDAVSYAGDQFVGPLLGYAQTAGGWVIDHRATASAAVGCIGKSLVLSPLECLSGARDGLGIMGEITTVLQEVVPQAPVTVDLSNRSYINDQSVPLLIDMLKQNPRVTTLDVRGTQMTQAGAKQLRDHLQLLNRQLSLVTE